MTGIELTADSCVLVDVRREGGLPRLEAIHVVEPSQWPPQGLARVRRRKHFPPQAHVVAWTSADEARRLLRRAGFAIGAILTPEQALGVLAVERATLGGPVGGVASAWMALTRQGAAIAIVRGRDILYSRRIQWHYKTATRLNEQLLQRYSLVAHLAPELSHGMDVVRQQHGVEVGAVVTCGDLPDLRSLTMPLIEELDLEVEILDSLEGLDVTPAALADKAADYAPALRLAGAVTSLPPVDAPRGWWDRAAATFALVGVLAWLGFSNWSAPSRSAVERPIELPSPTATAGSSTAEPSVVPLIPRSSPARAREAVPVVSEPLPALSSILYGSTRRLAILNGNIVAEGDAVGARRVLRIEREAVVLREPAGREVRVGVRRLKQASQP
jgi:hypothetical protein